MKKEIEKIEIPFRAKDSELYKFEYTIPEGYEARIEDGKVIVRKKESEDERIRKGLLEIFNKAQFGEWGKLKIKDIIAWLEKQKEQKPNIELIQRSWYMEGYHDREFGKEPKWIIKTGEGGPKYEENPKYGQMLEAEQKSAEWSEEEKEIINEVASILINDENRAENKREEDRLAYLAEKIQSLRPQPHWKPSKEQMKDLELASRMNGVTCPNLKSLYNDLKSL